MKKIFENAFAGMMTVGSVALLLYLIYKLWTVALEWLIKIAPDVLDFTISAVIIAILFLLLLGTMTILLSGFRR